MPKNLKPPSGNPPGKPPSGSNDGVVPCCTCPIERKIVSYDTMYSRYSYNGIHGGQNRCKIVIHRTNTGGVVTITKSFSIAYENNASAQLHQEIISTAITQAIKSWDIAASKYKVEVKQPGCPPLKLAMRFEHQIVAKDADVKVKVNGSLQDTRSFVKGGIDMTFFVNAGRNTAWIMTHEIGHTFGLPDEYWEFPVKPVQAPLPTVTHLGSPPQPDAVTTLRLNPLIPLNKEDNTMMYDAPTWMGQDEDKHIFAHHFYWVAIEVRRMMSNGTVVQIV